MIKTLTILLLLATLCVKAQNVVVDGNSLTASPFGYGQYINCTNIAVNGQSTLDMLNRFQDHLFPLYKPGKINIIVAWELSNDLFIHCDIDSAYQRFNRYCKAAKAIGFKVIVVSALPRWNGSNTECGEDSTVFNNSLLFANDLIATTWPLFADGFIDLRQRKEFVTINSTYYLPDGTHLNAAGDSVIAKLVHAEITKLTANDRKTKRN